MTKVRWPLASMTAVICAATLLFTIQSVRSIAAEDSSEKSSSASDANSSSDEDDSASADKEKDKEKDKDKGSKSKNKKAKKEVAPKKKATKSSRQPAGTRPATGQRSGSMTGSSGGSSGTSGSGRSANSNPGSGNSNSSSGDSTPGDTGAGSPAGGKGTAPQDPVGGPDPKLVQKAMDIQDKYTRGLMDQKGLAGTATGLNEKGEVVIKVYTTGADSPKIPNKLDGIPVEVEVTGVFRPDNGFAGSPQYDPKSKSSRPTPIGISTSPEDTNCAPSSNCYSGTLGCRVKGKDGSYYALSNNHVLANTNANAIGSKIMHPAVGELSVFCKCIPEDQIGELFKFKALDLGGGINRMDAAIARVDPKIVGRATLPDGYGLPRVYTVKKAFLGQNVMKYGRTTGFTKGRIIAVNAFTLVGYPTGLGFFTRQIVYRGTGGLFSAGGDSGSLVVDSNRFPVALHFAGGGGVSIGNPIQPILDEFGVEIDGDEALDFETPGKSGRTQPDSP